MDGGAGEAAGFGLGFGEAEEGGVSSFAGGGVFAWGFAEGLLGACDVEDVVNGLEGESEVEAEFGEGGGDGWGCVGGHGAELGRSGDKGSGFGGVDLAELGEGDFLVFGEEVSGLTADEVTAPGGGGEASSELGLGVIGRGG